MLAARDFKADLVALVAEHGGDVLNAAWREYHTFPGVVRCPAPVVELTPEHVVLHENAGQAKYLHAGFWAGLGVPVVYVGRPTGSKKRETNRAARAVGCYAVLDLAGFRTYLELHQRTRSPSRGR